MAPNLFHYATKELSQDAFLCWLLAWADPKFRNEDGALHAVGRSFVDKLLEMRRERCSEPFTISVQRQLMRADVVAEVGTDIVIIVEDKIHAGLHGEQLVRYRREMQEKFKGKRILPVFVKTGDQSSYRKVEEVGYSLLLRDQFLELLRPWHGRVSNAIFRDFLANLEWREAQIESYATRAVSIWTEEWDPWIGFYKRLQRELQNEVEWDYVANPSGGFLGAWWHFNGWRDPNVVAQDVYLQIEQGPLCFKIGVSGEEVDKSDLRARWREQLTATAREMGFEVKRPARMGLGTSMTVGRIELKDWMKERADGLLDVEGTVAFLRVAASVLDRAVGS